MYVVVDKDAIFTVSNHGSHSLLQTQQGGTNNITNSIHTYLELKGKNEITSGKEAIALGAANGTQNLVFCDPDPGRRWMNDMGIHGALPCPLGRWVFITFGHGARRKARQGVSPIGTGALTNRVQFLPVSSVSFVWVHICMGLHLNIEVTRCRLTTYVR